MQLLLVPPLVGFEGSLPLQEEVCNGQGCLLSASIADHSQNVGQLTR